MLQTPEHKKKKNEKQIGKQEEAQNQRLDKKTRLKLHKTIKHTDTKPPSSPASGWIHNRDHPNTINKTP